MAYCGPAGIRYAEFLEWDDLSRDAALAWQYRQDRRCSSCGTVHDDWLNSRDAEGNLVADELAPVYVTDDIYCPGCAALDRHRRTNGEDEVPGRHPAFVANPHAAVLDDASLDDLPASPD